MRWTPGKAPHPTIDVSRETIDSSKQQSSSHCMVAMAIKKAVPTAKRIAVDIATIRWTDEKRNVRITFMTPRSVQVRIIQFDSGQDVKAFRFRLNGPAHVRDVNLNNSQARQWRAKKKKQGLPQRRLVGSTKTTTIPTVKGGKSPPQVRGVRREFGLRAFAGALTT